jgi:hypothetical protein
MKKSSIMNVKTSTLLKLSGCALLVFVTADLQAQLLFKTKFSAAEGYSNGWAIGQPTIGNKWLNANADWSYDASGAYTSLNNGHSWWPEGATEPWYIVTITNCTATSGAMKIASDGNFGTNAQTYFWKMDFPKQLTGPITVTWDWQFHCTNEIPADYDPTNNNYSGVLPGFDHGFTFSDYANRTAELNDAGDTIPNPNWKYSELCTPFRLSTYQDGRHNGIDVCGGAGGWNDYGPEFKDGKVLHMKLVAHVGNAPAEYHNSYEAWAQREGEDIWQTCFREDTLVTFIKNGVPVDMVIPASGMRRCPGEADPTSGINCLMLWMNGNQYMRYALVSDVVVLGPIPVLSVERSGTGVKLTYSGTLQSADAPQGPYTDLQAADFMKPLKTMDIPTTAARKFYRSYYTNSY